MGHTDFQLSYNVDMFLYGYFHYHFASFLAFYCVCFATFGIFCNSI